MPVMFCPDCGKQVAVGLSACPHCGSRMGKESNYGKLLVGALCGVGLGIIVLVILLKDRLW